MFEYWFIGLEDGGETGTTHDFLEVLSRIAQNFSPETAGRFTCEMLRDQKKQLSYLRVIEWKFEFIWFEPAEPENKYFKIILHKHM